MPPVDGLWDVRNSDPKVLMSCPVTASNDLAPPDVSARPEAIRRPTTTLNRFKMSRDAMTVGLSPKNGWVSHIAGYDVARFSTATRHFVALCHPDDIDHVLHAGRLNYYKSYKYELLRAILGVSGASAAGIDRNAGKIAEEISGLSTAAQGIDTHAEKLATGIDELVAILPTLRRLTEIVDPLDNTVARLGRFVDRIPGAGRRRNLTPGNA